MTADPAPRRLRLGAVVLCLVPCEPPRLWRVVGVEGEDAAAEVLLCGSVVTERDLRAALAGRLSLAQLAAHGIAALYQRTEG